MLVRISCALLAALVIAPASHAAAPIPGKTYEGAGPKGGSPAYLSVSGSGKRVKYLSAGFPRGCTIKGRKQDSQISIGPRNLKIRSGRFSWKRSIRYPQTGGYLKSRLTGRFVDGGRRFKATLREHLANPQNGVKCDSGKVRFGGAVPDRELIDGNWAGTTAQSAPLSLTIAKKRVTTLAFDVTLTCTNGEQLVRTFTLDERADVTQDLEFRAGHYVGEMEIGVTGRATPDLVSGRIAATEYIDRTDAEGDERSYTCKSGDVAFEARRTSVG